MDAQRNKFNLGVPCHICLPNPHPEDITEDRKIKFNQERKCVINRSFENLRQGELDGKKGEVGEQIWDFSYCPNMYLLKENLCPAELPMREPGERSCGNRTCPYREGS